MLDYKQAIASLETRLKDYLESKGINTSKNFSCINPDHEDKHPSCAIAPSGNVFYCFSCNTKGNIFKAAHYIENKPISGSGFIEGNLKYLAELFDVPLSTKPLTDDELFVIDTYRAYNCAAGLILDNPTDRFLSAIKDRGWSEEICRELGIGCVSSFKSFRESLKESGFSASFLDTVDLGRKDMFNEDSLIFTLKNEHGNPVGFAARNLNFTKDKENGEKYINTSAKCRIFKKSTRLYGIDRIIQKTSKKNFPIYIFEGYADVVTAYQSGLFNCVAASGSHLSIDQVQLLKDHSFYDIILSFDGDKPGRNQTAAVLDTVLGNHRDLKVRVINLPGDQDPDEFIRQNGISKFRKLETWSAFEWRLMRFSDESDPVSICESMIPLIANEPSSINQEEMIKVLSTRTGVSKKAISCDVEKIINSVEAEKQRYRQNVIDRLKRNLDRNPSDAEGYITEAEGSLLEITRKYDEDVFSAEEFVSTLQKIKKEGEEMQGVYDGFELGPDLEPLKQALCGSWKKRKWIAFGGTPNAGKSALVSKLAYEIASREENNACVIYHSTDDSKDDIINRMVCNSDPQKTLQINQVANPNFYIRNDLAQEDLLERRDEAFQKIISLARTGRLVVKDASDGSSLSFAKRMVRYCKQKYPDRYIVYVVDNFHKYKDFEEKSDERSRFKRLSSIFKDFATVEDILVISTVEYTKLQPGQRPTNNNVAESNQIYYDTSFIGHLYNELHEMGDRASSFHNCTVNGSTEKLPRVELIVGKNKISSFKGKQFYDFWPHNSHMKWISNKVALADAARARQDKKQEISEKKEVFKSLLEEARSSGKKDGYAAYRYKDRYGDFPPFEWREEV